MSSKDSLEWRQMMQMMQQNQMVPFHTQEIKKPNAKSVMRTLIQVYLGEAAWAFAGLPDEEDRLINMLKRANVDLGIKYSGRTVTIELELK